MLKCEVILCAMFYKLDEKCYYSQEEIFLTSKWIQFFHQTAAVRVQKSSRSRKNLSCRLAEEAVNSSVNMRFFPAGEEKKKKKSKGNLASGLWERSEPFK